MVVRGWVGECRKCGGQVDREHVVTGRRGMGGDSEHTRGSGLMSRCVSM